MYLIKHHYAVELARRGNEVYFLNPPDVTLGKTMDVRKHAEIDNLHMVTYRPIFPFSIRFRLRWLYDLLIGYQIKKIVAGIGTSFDIVWCFDLLLYTDLKKFGGALTIFHIGDLLYFDYQVKIAQSADVVFAVAEDILKFLTTVDKPKHFINHGISGYFEKYAAERLQAIGQGKERSSADKVKIGYTGNVLRPDIDLECFKEIILNNPVVEFHIWGPTTIIDNNVATGILSVEGQNEFIRFLEEQDNINLCGIKGQFTLAEEMQAMDGFLICYDIDRDQSKGTNYHKILEYISTGKVVISNNVSTYAGKADLVQMPMERHNANLVSLSTEVLGNVSQYNNEELQRKRLEFALENTYPKQIDRIEKILITYDR
jgi:hypothetical protein